MVKRRDVTDDELAHCDKLAKYISENFRYTDPREFPLDETNTFHWPSYDEEERRRRANMYKCHQAMKKFLEFSPEKPKEHTNYYDFRFLLGEAVQKYFNNPDVDWAEGRIGDVLTSNHLHVFGSLINVHDLRIWESIAYIDIYENEFIVYGFSHKTYDSTPYSIYKTSIRKGLPTNFSNSNAPGLASKIGPPNPIDLNDLILQRIPGGVRIFAKLFDICPTKLKDVHIDHTKDKDPESDRNRYLRWLKNPTEDFTCKNYAKEIEEIKISSKKFINMFGLQNLELVEEEITEEIETDEEVEVLASSSESESETEYVECDCMKESVEMCTENCLDTVMEVVDSVVEDSECSNEQIVNEVIDRVLSDLNTILANEEAAATSMNQESSQEESRDQSQSMDQENLADTNEALVTDDLIEQGVVQTNHLDEDDIEIIEEPVDKIITKLNEMTPLEFVTSFFR
ncbi:hypothetical protein [Carp edema virus]|nr:hypothetical protein [Carp edema virus]